MSTRRFLISATAIVLTAFLVREWFVLAAVTPNPTQGDVSAYLRYALHLAWDGTFSQAQDGMAVVPDAYRSPGYPWFLLAIFSVTGLDGWYPAVYQAQAVLGAVTVAGVIALARQWMPRGWALAAGVLMALQPHHIAATGTMLVEVLLGFVIVAGLLCSVVAMRTGSLPAALLAGVVWGFGYLVNPVLGLFPFVLAALFWREGVARNGLALLLVACVAVGGWSLRNRAQSAAADGRAWENLVQGSYPGYHQASKWWVWHPEEKALLEAMNAEIQLVKVDRSAGLAAVTYRLAEHPGTHAAWYLFQKPYLLWDWDIRMGAGGIYTLDVRKSPLDRMPLQAATFSAWTLNPVMFLLALGGIALAWRGPSAARLAALFAVYITAVHVVFQAEPRYAIAYRSAEILMAVSAAAWLTQYARSFRLNQVSGREPISGRA